MTARTRLFSCLLLIAVTFSETAFPMWRWCGWFLGRAGEQQQQNQVVKAWDQIAEGLTAALGPFARSPEEEKQSEALVTQYLKQSFAQMERQELLERRATIQQLLDLRIAQRVGSEGEARKALLGIDRRIAEIDREHDSTLTPDNWRARAGLEDSNQELRERALSRLETELDRELSVLAPTAQIQLLSFLGDCAHRPNPIKLNLEGPLTTVYSVLSRVNEWSHFVSGMQQLALRRLAVIGTEEAWTMVGHALANQTISVPHGQPFTSEVAQSLLTSEATTPQRVAGLRIALANLRRISPTSDIRRALETGDQILATLENASPHNAQ